MRVGLSRDAAKWFKKAIIQSKNESLRINETMTVMSTSKVLFKLPWQRLGTIAAMAALLTLAVSVFFPILFKDQLFVKRVSALQDGHNECQVERPRGSRSVRLLIGYSAQLESSPVSGVIELSAQNETIRREFKSSEASTEYWLEPYGLLDLTCFDIETHLENLFAGTAASGSTTYTVTIVATNLPGGTGSLWLMHLGGLESRFKRALGVTTL